MQARRVSGAVFDRYFDRVVVLSLPRCADRATRIIDELKSEGLSTKAEVVRAIDGAIATPSDWFTAGNGAWGCLMSHFRIVQDALLDGIESVLIVEDDGLWQKNIAELFSEFIEQVPDDWGQIYLGGQIRNNKAPLPIYGRPAVMKARRVHRTHAYAIHRSAMNQFLKHILYAPDYIKAAAREKPKNRHVDHQLEVAHEREDWPVYVPSFWLAGQGEGRSNINGRVNREKWWHHRYDDAYRGLPMIACDRAPTEDEMRCLHFGYTTPEDPTIDTGVAVLAGGEVIIQGMRLIAIEAFADQRLPAFPADLAEIADVLAEAWPGGVIRLSSNPDLRALRDFPSSKIIKHNWLNPGWHNQAAYDLRIADRRASLAAPKRFKCFYHVACMGNWQEVVAEQMEVFQRVGLTPETVVLGTEEQADWVSSLGIDVVERFDALTEYELPTLKRIHEWCRVDPGAAVLYVHTKGVSSPENENQAHWRRLMMHYLVEPWERNLASLKTADIVGVNWQNSPDYPHFAGNFWMARADWISSLPSPVSHQLAGGPEIYGHPWRRMSAEMWIGSKGYHVVKSLCCSDQILWEGPAVLSLLTAAESNAEKNQTLAGWLDECAAGGAATVLDLGCGECEWVRGSKAITSGEVEYFGIDISEDIIHQNQQEYRWFNGEAKDAEVHFRTKADVVIVTDVLSYLCNGMAGTIMQSIGWGEWKHLLISTSPGVKNGYRRGLADRKTAKPINVAAIIKDIKQTETFGEPRTMITSAGVDYVIYSRS